MKECRNHGFCTPMMVCYTGCENAILKIINNGKNCYIKEIKPLYEHWICYLIFGVDF